MFKDKCKSFEFLSAVCLNFLYYYKVNQNLYVQKVLKQTIWSHKGVQEMLEIFKTMFSIRLIRGPVLTRLNKSKNKSLKVHFDMYVDRIVYEYIW
jgi:hypothetical protein